MSWNDTKDSNRKDDFTIEKVSLTKEQLDKSLFEYEQNKNLKKYSTSVKSLDIEKSDKERTVKKIKKLDESVSIEDVEKSFDEFKANKENFEIISAPKFTMFQKENFKILDEKSLSISLDEIEETLKSLDNEFNLKMKAKTDQKKDKKEEESNEPVDLKTLYKWEPVEKKAKISEKYQDNQQIKSINKKIKSAKSRNDLVDKRDHPDGQNYLTYSYYYAYFYKHYFNNFLNKN